ncbi:MAG: hypothetical protein ABSF24_05255 [Candidatus Bathyarchaeia archaeon]
MTALVVYAKRRSRVKQGLPKEGSKTDGTIFPSASSADDAVYV